MTLGARAGEGGRLFGSITSADVAAAVKDAGGPLLDRKRIRLPGHIKSTGSHTVTVELHPDVVATVPVTVTARLSLSVEPELGARFQGPEPGVVIAYRALPSSPRVSIRQDHLPATDKKLFVHSQWPANPRDSRADSVSRPAIHTAVHRSSTSVGGCPQACPQVGAQATCEPSMRRLTCPRVGCAEHRGENRQRVRDKPSRVFTAIDSCCSTTVGGGGLWRSPTTPRVTAGGMDRTPPQDIEAEQSCSAG